jgi:hypothetical protein
MNDQEIKALIPVTCPHCSKPLVVEFITSAPRLEAVMTSEMIEQAKAEAVVRINALHLPEETSLPIISWINNPETIFSPDDVNDIVKQAQASKETQEI